MPFTDSSLCKEAAMIRPFRTNVIPVVILLLTATQALAAAPETLKWRDLVNRPERWPSETTVKNDLQFSKSTLSKETPVKVFEVKANGVDLIAPEGFIFEQSPQDCNLLEDANTFWSSLTAEQKDLDWSKIVADRTLWPDTVTLTTDVYFRQNAKIDQGEQVPVVTVEAGQKVVIMHPKVQGTLRVNSTETDIFSRARELAGKPESEHPGIMAAVLDGRLLDGNGQKLDAKPADYYIIYYAASTCPRCAVFSPKFVEYYNEHFAGRNDLQVVVWSTERPKSNILKYMRDHQMPFATLNDDDAGMVVYAFRKQGVIVNIPGFIVIDRFGRELYSTGGTGEAQTIPTAEASLEKIAALLP